MTAGVWQGWTCCGPCLKVLLVVWHTLTSWPFGEWGTPDCCVLGHCLWPCAAREGVLYKAVPSLWHAIKYSTDFQILCHILNPKDMTEMREIGEILLEEQKLWKWIGMFRITFTLSRCWEIRQTCCLAAIATEQAELPADYTIFRPLLHKHIFDSAAGGVER